MVEVFVLLLFVDTVITGFMVGAYVRTVKAFNALQSAYASSFEALFESMKDTRTPVTKDE